MHTMKVIDKQNRLQTFSQNVLNVPASVRPVVSYVLRLLQSGQPNVLVFVQSFFFHLHGELHSDVRPYVPSVRHAKLRTKYTKVLFVLWLQNKVSNKTETVNNILKSFFLLSLFMPPLYAMQNCEITVLFQFILIWLQYVYKMFAI